MAQAAWSRPSINISSWACIGPRRRPAVANANSPESSSSNAEAQSISTALELPVSSSDDTSEWHANELNNEEVNEPSTHEDRMTEFELWEKLEHELYDQSEGEEADVAKEMREEEEAAIAEGIKSPSESNTPETKESHRFFPAGKIMHLVTIPQVVTESESSSSDSDNDQDRDRDRDQDHVVEDKVGIFLT